MSTSGEWSDMSYDQVDSPTESQLVPADVWSRRSAESRLNLDDCRSVTSPFGALVSETAQRVDVDPRSLAVRALLQLPRVACSKGWITRSQAWRELRISAERLHSDARAASNHIPGKRFRLRDLAFEEIDSCRALPVLASLHYLRSIRPSSRYFGLVDPIDKLPVSICSISPLQWRCVGSHIRRQFAISQEGVWDLSRLYSVDGAPTNSISFLLSKVRTHLRKSISTADLLVTAVDPNLGFTGCSYRAANWQQWMTVMARPYLYENGHYVSPRQLRERFGTANLNHLQTRHPGRFEKSEARLLDSIIYCCSVNEKTKVVPAQEMRRLHR